ncbi:unnamed protein product [Tuber aestivum]|uniref:Uncharacterized protein n=1 Tax=Tuber aestivum TaxID=59557 RepID=A0A292Q122_9PEZI|nr:unnamed protein product [Tuber aestivum]
MSFSCVGSEDSPPPPPAPPPPPPLSKRYTDYARESHLSILAPTDWDEWVPPPGVQLKTDVICFSCRKAPGRDDIGLCKNCSPILSNPRPRDSRFTLSNYARDSFCGINPYRPISQYGSIIFEEDEAMEDDGDSDDGIDFSDAYYAIMYEEWREQEELKVRREEKMRKRRADKRPGRNGMGT